MNFLELLSQIVNKLSLKAVGVVLVLMLIEWILAVNITNNSWEERIKNAPVKIDTVRTVEYIKVPDTGGSSISIVIQDSETQTRIDSLLKSNTNKDSLIAELSLKRNTTINDSIGTLWLQYSPLDKIFDWRLTNRPPIKKETVYVNSEKVIPMPYRRIAVLGNINVVGQTYVGLSYRFESNWMLGISYQVAGPVAGNKLQLNIGYNIF